MSLPETPAEYRALLAKVDAPVDLIFLANCLDLNWQSSMKYMRGAVERAIERLEAQKRSDIEGDRIHASVRKQRFFREL